MLRPCSGFHARIPRSTSAAISRNAVSCEPFATIEQAVNDKTQPFVQRRIARGYLSDACPCSPFCGHCQTILWETTLRCQKKRREPERWTHAVWIVKLVANHTKRGAT